MPRLRGVRARPDWGMTPYGLLLPRCRAVHTFGLRAPIDVVFLSPQGDVLRFVPSLAPGRWAFCREAWGVLELPGGYCSRPDWPEVLASAWGARKMVA